MAAYNVCLSYIRHLLELLTSRGEKAEFSVAVVNARGCSYSKLTSPIMYHPQATWDLRQFVQWEKRQWPYRGLFAVGFSIEANLCNYLGEEGESCELEAAILVGNPWNLDIMNIFMANSIMGLHIYQRALGTAFKKTFERHIEMISQNASIDVKKARESTYICQWDRHVQCPIWAYPTENSYYRDTSCVDAVAAIKISVLVLHAKDDPICLDLAVPYHLIESNPYIVMCTTSIGGHLGWFGFGGSRWSNKMIHSFLKRFIDDTQYSKCLSSVIENPIIRDRKEVGKPTFDPTQRKMLWPTSPPRRLAEKREGS